MYTMDAARDHPHPMIAINYTETKKYKMRQLTCGMYTMDQSEASRPAASWRGTRRSSAST